MTSSGWRDGRPRVLRAVGATALVLWTLATACGRSPSSGPETPPAGGGIASPADSAPAPSPGASPVTGTEPLETLRAEVAEALGQPVTLEVDELRSDGDWIFVVGVPRTPAGEPVDYTDTAYADAIAAGEFDDWLCALLERVDGGWRVVALEIGATDVPFVDWPARYGAPPALVMPGAAQD